MKSAKRNVPEIMTRDNISLAVTEKICAMISWANLDKGGFAQDVIYVERVRCEPDY